MTVALITVGAMAATVLWTSIARELREIRRDSRRYDEPWSRG